MDGDEFLQTSQLPEVLHRPLPSSERQMRILGAIVQPAPSFPPVRIANFLNSSTVGAQFVSNDSIRSAVASHCILYKLQCSSLIPCPRHVTFQDFSLVINSSPQVVPFAVDLHEHLVQMPASTARFHTGNAPSTDLRGAHLPNLAPPRSNGFMAHINAAFT